MAIRILSIVALLLSTAAFASADEKRIIDANSKAQELTGRTQTELGQMAQAELFPPEEADRYDRIFTDHAVNDTVVDEDLFLAHKTGPATPVDISASLSRGGEQETDSGNFS